MDGSTLRLVSDDASQFRGTFVITARAMLADLLLDGSHVPLSMLVDGRRVEGSVHWLNEASVLIKTLAGPLVWIDLEDVTEVTV